MGMVNADRRGTAMPMRYFFLMTMALCLAGCATPQPELIAYYGPHRTDDNVAMLKTQLPIYVVAIDGDTSEHASPPTRRYQGTTVYLAPGQHRLTLVYFSGTAKGRSPANLDMYLWAGHRYIVVADAKQPSFWLGRGGTWRPVLEDVTDLPQEWQPTTK
jgi:hypothetical protein